MHKTIKVGLDDRSYDIVIGEGLLGAAGIVMQPALKSKKVIIVTDRNVAGHYLASFRNHLKSCGVDVVSEFVLDAGENSKSFSVLQDVIDKILSCKPSRSMTLIALGGGVVGDLCGFAASIILRGIPFIQIPTTLLAQVDSSVGGKTGINTPQGKNMVGSFYQPKMVIADVDLLKTLPRREMLAGYAEVLKYALINNPSFFKWLEGNFKKIIELDAQALAYAVEISCKAKSEIVMADENETSGLRALLNLGHTFGHALEGIGGYDGRLLHGEAVAIGMRMAFNFSYYLKLCPEQDVRLVEAHLDKTGLPAKPSFSIIQKELVDFMMQDKKTIDGKLSFILVKGIGQAFKADNVSLGDLNNFLEIYLKSW